MTKPIEARPVAVIGAGPPAGAGRLAGAGHSATNLMLELAELAQQAPHTRIVWALRANSTTRATAGGQADALPARGALGARLSALRDRGGLTVHSGFHVEAIEQHGVTLTVLGMATDGSRRRIDGIDRIVGATGQRPDLDMTRELRLALDPALECNAIGKAII